MLVRWGIIFTFWAAAASNAGEIPDLRTLAKETRPAVYLLVLQDEDGKSIGSGTGFLVSPDGLLVSNHHVIAEAKSIIAKAENGGLFPVVHVLGTDLANDLALLQIEGKNLSFLSLAPEGSADAGTRIAVIGSPLGLEGTLTEGIVSARRRLLKEKRDVLQISAPISQGSSGSPVLDSQGRVVGIASFLLQDGQSLNFASPSEKLRALLIKEGHPTSSLAEKSAPIIQTKSSGISSPYIVKTGDTLTRISRDLAKQGVRASPDQIRTLNQLATNSILRPGQTLKIPNTHP